MQGHAGQGQAHGFAAGQALAAIAEHDGRLRLRHLGQVGQVQRLRHLRGVRPHAAQGHVLADGCGKHVRTLAHPRHALAQGIDGAVDQAHAADADVAAAGGQQAGQQGQQGGLAGAAGAQQGHVFAGAHGQVEAVKHGRLAGMGKAQLPEFHGGRRRHGHGGGGNGRDFHAGARQGHAIGRQVVQTGQARFAGRLVVPDGGQFAQRFEERGGQQQDEQALPQAQFAAPGAEIDAAQQRETDEGRHHGHAERGKQFQHGRRQKGDAQHHHRAPAYGLRRGIEPFGRGVDGVERAQGGQAAQAVQQEGIHAAHFHHLRAAGRLRTHADERHEDGNQGGRDEQDQGGDPRQRRHHGEDHERHEHHFPARGFVAHQIRHDGFGLLGDDAGRLARLGPLAVQRRTLRQRLRHLRAQGGQVCARRRIHAPRAPRFAAGAQHAQQQHASGRQQGRAPGCTALHGLHGPGQQGRLRQPQQGGAALRQAGETGKNKAGQGQGRGRHLLYFLSFQNFL
ncbi:hypothetical protein D3C85_642970 [compost metagenome]